VAGGKMKTYVIPVTLQMIDEMEFEAESLADAIAQAKDMYPYLSVEVEFDLILEYNDDESIKKSALAEAIRIRELRNLREIQKIEAMKLELLDLEEKN
jgi:hypothetical protein